MPIFRIKATYHEIVRNVAITDIEANDESTALKLARAAHGRGELPWKSERGDMIEETTTYRALGVIPEDWNGDGDPFCNHSWVTSDETDRSYCELCGADGDA